MTSTGSPKAAPPAPAFSVLMPNYNRGRYLPVAIDSVLGQSHQDWELVIVDDASTDESIQVLERCDDSRIRWLRNPLNVGLIRTLERLIATARAEIVGILDSDDALLPEALARVLDAYADHPECGVVYTQHQVCNAALEPQYIGGCRRIPDGQSNLTEDAVFHFKTFRKSAFARTTGFDETILFAEDKDLIYKLEEVTRMFFLDDPLYLYRVLPDGQAHAPRKQLIGRASMQLARYRAFLRRLKTGVPNTSADDIVRGLHHGARLNSRAGRDAEARRAVWRATKAVAAALLRSGRLFQQGR